LTVKGERVTFDEILQNLNERDDHDTNREINPLLQAEDAVLIDNSALSIQDQNDLIDNLINTKNNESNY
jgi:CMP/dCMP kinase